ncbi:MAG: PqqD family protein, partial [Candidatus Methanoperedens sp.]|nr:PqqD family protein [Candidatus Methanoperedens sp.]
YEHEVSRGMLKNETDELIQEFYNKLSFNHQDLPIWSNLDREHLFLYISHYKREKNKVANLAELIERVQKNKPAAKDNDFPALSEGIFVGTFNFNLAQIIHTMLAGNALNNLQKERTNVLFDTNNNRIFTITDFAKDILDNCNGKLSLFEITGVIKKKYQLPYSEAEFKCKNFFRGLIEKKIIN